MTASTYYNGNKINYDFVNKKWHYEDGTTIDEYKICPKCGKLPTKEGHDACMSNLPGVKNACCGHGVEDGYIQFEDDTVIRFKLIKIERG